MIHGIFMKDQNTHTKKKRGKKKKKERNKKGKRTTQEWKQLSGKAVVWAHTQKIGSKLLLPEVLPLVIWL